MSNNNLNLNGYNPLSYMGVNPYSPLPFVINVSNPTTTDYQNFYIGTIWLNSTTQEVWMLVKKYANIATWVEFTAGSGSVDEVPTDSGTAFPVGGVLNIKANVATNHCGATVSFDGSGNTVELNVTAGASNTIIGQGSGPLNIAGLDSVTIVGQGCASILASGLGTTIIGAKSGVLLTSPSGGLANTLIGAFVAPVMTTGFANCSLGLGTMLAATDASQNSIFGFNAGKNFISADQNIIIGANSGNSLLGSEQNNIIIGTNFPGETGENQTCRIDNIYNITPNLPPFQTVVIDSTGQLGTSDSVATEYITSPATGTAVPSNNQLVFAGIDGIVVSAATDTITIGTDGTVALDFITNPATGTATPAAGEIVIEGTNGVTVTAATNVITIDGAGINWANGTWTPTLSFGGSSTGITYGTQTGKFWESGPMVFFTMTLIITSKGAQVGTALISGLPFASANDTYNHVCNTVMANYNSGGGNYLGLEPQGFILPNTTTMNLVQNGNAAALAIFPADNVLFSNITEIYMSGFYWTS